PIRRPRPPATRLRLWLIRQVAEYRKDRDREESCCCAPRSLPVSMINDILLQSLLILLCAGSIVGVLVGTGMLLRPERIAFLNQYFSRWVSADKIEEQLDRPRWTERSFYRHHQLVGGILLVGAIFVLYIFLFSYNVRKISAVMALGNWELLDALVGMLLVGSVLAALVGIIVLARPSLLRDIEKSTNRWISAERMVKCFNSTRYSFDQHILRHRKIAGILMVIGNLGILIALGPFLWRGGWKF
ncbi:MAG: hypothetical protein WBM28_04765, partial [Burkholderiales bacterium]